MFTLNASDSVSFSLLDLPDPCLVAVLRCCAEDPRSLFNAARAHSRLHHLVQIAASNISAVVPQQQQADNVLQYLAAYGQHIRSIGLASGHHKFFDDPRSVKLHQLPYSQLQELTGLKLEGLSVQLQPGWGFQGVLGVAVSTCLRKLQLHSCTLRDGEEGLVAALALLPKLEHLSLVGISSLKGVSFPSNVLQTLQHLTYLETTSGWLQDEDGIWPLQRLTRLQDLRLNCLGLCTIQASMLSGMARLTRLTVGGGCGWGAVVEPGVLAGKPQLRHLELTYCSSAEGPAGVTQLLSHLWDLQQLTHLDLRGSLDDSPSADYSALTASSKLHHLNIGQCTLPDDVWQQVFPAGPGMQPAWLPHLRDLRIDRLHHPEGGALSRQAVVAPDISRLVTCCPGLRSLDMWRLKYSATALAALTGLSNLTELHMCPAGDPTRGLEVVC
jgi:hypothetical protein